MGRLPHPGSGLGAHSPARGDAGPGAIALARSDSGKQAGAEMRAGSLPVRQAPNAHPTPSPDQPRLGTAGGPEPGRAPRRPARLPCPPALPSRPLPCSPGPAAPTSAPGRAAHGRAGGGQAGGAPGWLRCRGAGGEFMNGERCARGRPSREWWGGARDRVGGAPAPGSPGAPGPARSQAGRPRRDRRRVWLCWRAGHRLPFPSGGGGGRSLRSRAPPSRGGRVSAPGPRGTTHLSKLWSPEAPRGSGGGMRVCVWGGMHEVLTPTPSPAQGRST